MISKSAVDISRRHFVASGSLVVAAAWLLPNRLWAQEGSLVENARKEGISAKVTLQKLRGNVSALLGAGGNIAVLTGRDGKLLVDAGFATSRQQVSDALNTISPDPIKHLINTHWHFDHTDGNDGSTKPARPSSLTGTHANICQPLHESKVGITRFLHRPQAQFQRKFSMKNKPSISTEHLWCSNTMNPPTPTRTSQSTLRTRIFFTPATPGGTASIRSLTIQPEAASTA